MMKLLVHSFLMLCLLACKEEDIFDIYTYDGEYPKNVDGTRIITYTPEIIGGDVQMHFNGHPWNYSPIISLNATVLNSESSRIIEVSVHALMTNVENDACGLESFFFRVPLETGKLHLDNKNKDDAYTKFLSVNCDATKDDFQMDSGKDNWIDLVQFNTSTRDLNAEFDLNFVISDRNSDFGPIYPAHVHLKGKIETVAKIL